MRFTLTTKKDLKNFGAQFPADPRSLFTKIDKNSSKKMDQVEQATLHYAMLEYIFDNHKLATSCFSYAWEDFIRDNSEYSHMTPTELKTIFWTEIATNIASDKNSYNLLTNEQKEYFTADEFPIETDYDELQSVLEHNEPKAGVDFTFFRSTSAYGSANDQTLRQKNQEEMMETIKKAFANPTLHTSVFDDTLTEVDEEDTRINVIAQKPTSEIDTGEDPLEIYKFLLLSADEMEAGLDLDDDELLARLANEDLDINFGDLPEGLQHYLKQFGDTVLYKNPAKKGAVTSPRPTTSTPLVTPGSNPPAFRFTRSQSVSEITKKRRMLVQNSTGNVRGSPQRGTRANRNKLFTSSSDTSISTINKS